MAQDVPQNNKDTHAKKTDEIGTHMRWRPLQARWSGTARRTSPTPPEIGSVEWWFAVVGLPPLAAGFRRRYRPELDAGRSRRREPHSGSITAARRGTGPPPFFVAWPRSWRRGRGGGQVGSGLPSALSFEVCRLQACKMTNEFEHSMRLCGLPRRSSTWTRVSATRR